MSTWYQLIKSPDAVRKRCALALSEIFVVSMTGITNNWPHLAMANYWDQLVQQAFGNYRDLLDAITLQPAMGTFLNTHGNLKEDEASGRIPDENYAREVMQLFSIGLYELNDDGSLRRDAAGLPIETYGASDVSNLARVFTGYSVYDDGRRFPIVIGGERPYYEGTSRPRLQFAQHLLQATVSGCTARTDN